MTAARATSTTRRSIAAAAAAVPLMIAALVGIYWWWHDGRVTIGVEGRRVVEIAGPLLAATPFTPGDAVSLRIAEATRMDGGYRYDLRYIVYGPGEHDLATRLYRPDDPSVAPPAPIKVSVASVLPDKHGGELFDAPTSGIDLHSNYALTMRLLWGLWALLFVPLVLYGRRRRRTVAPEPPPPTVAQRLRALLERAAATHLSPAEQVDLEQLLLAYWSERLNLDEARLSDALDALRRDPTAARQLAGVERWFHGRQTPANGELARELLRDLGSLSPGEFRLPQTERRR